MSKTQCDHHLASVSCDLTGVPNPDTPCKRCQYPRADWNWCCLSCKDVICSFNNHHSEHYQQTKHCLCVNCSSQAIWCCSCREYLDAQTHAELQTSSMETWCGHIASLVSSDLTNIPNPDTPCRRCHPSLPNPYPIWRCLYCKFVFCGYRLGSHMYEHHKESNHSLAISCSKKDPIVFCYFCNINAKAHHVIQQLQAFSKNPASLSKLEKLDGMMVDVGDLIWKPYPDFDFHPPDAKSFFGQDEFAFAREGIQKILYRGLEALADDQVQKEFLAYSAILLSVDSCPPELKANLSSFRENLPEETSTFVQARNELRVASDLSASITRKKFLLQQQTSRYTEVKKELISSEKKIADLKATIEKLEASVAAEETKKAKIDKVLDSIETQVTTAKDGLASDLAKVYTMEGKPQAANQLVGRRQSAWDRLRTTFTKFA